MAKPSNGKSFHLSNAKIYVNGELRDIEKVDIRNGVVTFASPLPAGEPFPVFEVKLAEITATFTAIVRCRRARWYPSQAWRCQRRAR